MKSILDPSFCYTPSANTNLKKTFARIRREQHRQNDAQARADAEVKTKVLPIQRSRAVASDQSQAV